MLQLFDSDQEESSTEHKLFEDDDDTERTIIERNWTNEQKHVIDFIPYAPSIVMVSALPGTGKTTVCEKLISQHASSTRKFYFTMLSLRLAQEAERRIACSSVACGTFHSLALQIVQKIHNSIQFEIQDNLENVDKNIVMFLEEYWISDEDCLLKFYDFKQQEIQTKKRKRGFCIVEKAEKIWKDMQIGKIPLTHQAYLKMCSIDPKAVDVIYKMYQCIVVDEAQDVPPCFVKFLLKLKQCCIYFVGDPNQQIFSFAGAASAFGIDKIKHRVTSFYLTQSFRFGPHVADIANKTVLKCRKESTVPFPNIISTLESTHSLITFEPNVNIYDFKEPFTLICRYNATLLQHALQSIENQMFFHMIGTPVLDIIKVIPFWLEKFQSWPLSCRAFEFEHTKNVLYARPQGGSKDVQALKFVYSYHDRLHDFSERFEKYHVGETQAKMILVSAHQSKGMEFDVVVLGDDYPDIFENVQEGPSLFDCDEKEIHQNNEETNILFVAITRCKKKLYLNSMLGKYGKDLFSEKLSNHFLFIE